MTHETRKVLAVSYKLHIKMNAPDTHPRTVKCSYKIGENQWVSRWICPEHDEGSRAHDGFVDFWQAHMGDDNYPANANDAAEILQERARRPHSIDIRMQDNGFYEVVGYHMGGQKERPKPEPEPEPVYEGADDEDDIPF
jgi:hypothetical protein